MVFRKINSLPIMENYRILIDCHLRKLLIYIAITKLYEYLLKSNLLMICKNAQLIL